MKRILVLALIILPGCSIKPSTGWDDPNATPPPLHEEMHTSNLVKIIASDINELLDPSTFDQLTHTVADNRRMLMSYTDLGNHIEKIDTAHGGKVILQISLVHVSDSETAEASFEVCPITQQWTLASNWQKRSSFGKGRWNSPGGDLDLSGCVKGTHVKYDASQSSAAVKKDASAMGGNPQAGPTPSPSPSPTPIPAPDGTIYFDITQWYLNYPKGRGVNFGLALRSSVTLDVVGKRSGAKSPRVYWFERD